ncbi:MAG TPA: DNA cytosine methyltransferase, partial [Candidatus Wunengus sp. YC60]|uniref:DNA cytosine methyltransferase n=1 Tax=Candidatus Wunengus sp. YC60 TaxID=3367697 RepID=UPI0040296FF0
MNNQLTHLDLFSGIGGFGLAAKWNGLKTIQFVEIDPFCRKVLTKNFPGVPIHDDIKTFTYSECGGLHWQTVPIQLREPRQKGDVPTRCNQQPFLLTGGFPCQPFSCAGKQRGTDDARYLWPEMLRVIREAKPINIIGENVAGLINMAEFDSELEMDSEANLFGDVTIKSVKRGRGILDRIICQLEEIGYQVQAFVIPACAVGAPHRRDRVWIVAHSEGNGTYRGQGAFRGEDGGQDGRLLSESNDTDRHATNTKSRPQSQADQTSTVRRDNARQNAGRMCVANSNTGIKGLQGCEPGQPLRLSGQPDRSGRNQKPDWSENWLEVATRLCRVDDG